MAERRAIADESEELAVGAALHGPEATAYLLERLHPEDLRGERPRAAYRAIAALAGEGTPVDVFTVGKALGDPLYARDLAERVPVPQHFAAYVDAARDQASKRRVAEAGQQLVAAALNGHDRRELQELAEQIRAQFDPDLEGVFVPRALEWQELLASGLPRVQWIEHPYIPEASRVWIVGPAGGGKSIWGQWLCARLSREGLHVAYYSQENPLAEDVRRLERLRPDWSRFRFFHPQTSPVLDLSEPEHVRGVIADAQAHGSTLLFFDTFTGCWRGDESDNALVAAFDRDVLQVIVRETGATTVVLDHPGHPQAFVRRSGVSAPRGASAKGQKTDILLELRPDGPTTFRIEQGKARVGGQVAPPASYEVIDTDDGGLDIVQVKGAEELKVEDLAERMAEAIAAAPDGFLTTRGLREAVHGARDLQDAAMRLLESEEPARVRAGQEVVDTGRGRQRAKVWRGAASVPPHLAFS